ncbi:hypothetical protein B9Z55_028877 [Caenorhabditis nigoni]|uniref:Senescence-associated protein n=1 Tax=Caenorhabditis nigoni TaxID=1611254 RepID=A0A2G5S9M0_9PELO|nr:hypothetical protein B9Z55_028877 [Caenorhabditis nigoni]
MDAWLPQASYPCGNFSDTFLPETSGLKGSIGHAFASVLVLKVKIKQAFALFALREMYRPSQTPRLTLSSRRVTVP